MRCLSQWDAYPKLPPTTTFPPVKLDAGLYYVNAFEPWVVYFLYSYRNHNYSIDLSRQWRRKQSHLVMLSTYYWTKLSAPAYAPLNKQTQATFPLISFLGGTAEKMAFIYLRGKWWVVGCSVPLILLEALSDMLCCWYLLLTCFPKY